MADHTTQRRLAAILAADVAAYTRRMEEDSDGTVAAWQAARDDVIEPSIQDHSGRLVKLTGDGFLAEFPAVQDAVNCAIAMQAGLASSSLEFRIGVNLGDIIDDGRDIHGEGVNVAARLEGLAEPGGIVISGGVYEQIRNRIKCGYQDMGEQVVKNVSAPVRAYAVIGESPVADPAPPSLPDKPSIAVLPFNNLSGDPEQEYFSDGITEDIITALSHIRQFFVIARNTTFTYKGQAVNVQAMAKDLGVRYVLEGSVRKAGDRVRITAQLIDGASGSHLWAEKYDRELADIFAVQDEITETVAGAIAPAIAKAEIEKARSKPHDSLDAWAACQRGNYHFNRYTPDDMVEAEKFYCQAIALDPKLVAAHAGLARKICFNSQFETRQITNADFAEALDEAQTAVDLDSEDSYAHTALGFVLMQRAHSVGGSFDDGVAAFEHALILNPNSAISHFGLGRTLTGKGESDAAIGHLETALRLSPRDPTAPRILETIGRAQFHLGNYQGTVDFSIEAQRIDLAISWVNAAEYVAALALLGRNSEAKAAKDSMLEKFPDMTCASVKGGLNAAHIADVIKGLRIAGVPEG
ncbi:MAG: tetratricopeptide repeat protein [Rhodospirillales bacterium]